jgi:hypothetical protein
VSSRRELITALGLAAGLVILRSWVFVAYEQSSFTSDQAVVGLMAKHISEGRAFPLFYYGLPYLLAVEAYVAVPFVLIGGPTVAALHASLVAWNITAAVLLVAGLRRFAGVRPMLGLAAAACFIFAPPQTSSLLSEAIGGNIEPFVYVLLAWWLRDRPLWLGAMLGIGFLNREFTIFAVPALVGADLVRRGIDKDVARRWMLTLIAFVAVWDASNALQPYADFLGPGTRGQMLRGYPAAQLANLSERTGLSLAAFPARLETAVGHSLPILLGGLQYEDAAAQGRDWMRWPILASLALMSLRIAWLVIRTPRVVAHHAFAFYLLGIGATMLVAFPLVRMPEDGTLRYVLMLLFVPVGVTATLFAIEPRRLARATACVLVAGWAAASAADHLAYARRYLGGQPNDVRVLADELIATHVTVAKAPYWIAYKLTYVARERVKVASTDVVRIEEYQKLADAAGPSIPEIRRVSGSAKQLPETPDKR